MYDVIPVPREWMVDLSLKKKKVKNLFMFVYR